MWACSHVARFTLVFFLGYSGQEGYSDDVRETSRSSVPEPVASPLAIKCAELFKMEDGTLVFHVQTARPVAAKNLRLFINLDGAQTGLAPLGADFMIEDLRLHRLPAGRRDWSWEAEGEVHGVFEGNDAYILFPSLPEKPSVRWSVETLSPDWNVADRFPAEGLSETVLTHAPMLSALAPEPAGDFALLLSNRLESATASFRDRQNARVWEVEVPHPSSNIFGSLSSGVLAKPLSLRLRLLDAETGTSRTVIPASGSTSAGGMRRWKGRDLDLDWTLVIVPAGPEEFHAELELTSGKDRCIQATLLASLPDAPWQWQDHLYQTRSAEKGKGLFRTTHRTPYGVARQQSIYPFGVALAPSGAVAWETDSTEPRVFQIYFDPEETDLCISWELGLASSTKRFPCRATAGARLRVLAHPDSAFRQIVYDWHQRHNTGRPFPPIASWNEAGLSPGAPAADGVAVAEVERPVPSREAVRQFVRMQPWQVTRRFPEGAPQSDAEALRALRFERAIPAGSFQEAASILTSASRKSDGSILTTPLGGSAQWILNADPEWPVTADSPYSRLRTLWPDVLHSLEPASSGIYITGLTQPGFLDYHPEASAIANYPTTFHMQETRPGIASSHAVAELLFPLRNALHAENRYLALQVQNRDFPFAAEYGDLFYEPADGGLDSAALSIRRTLAGLRPWAIGLRPMVLSEDPAAVDATLDSCLFWAISPLPLSSEEGYSNLPEFTSRLEFVRPLILRLQKAGWNVRGFVQVSNPSLRVECYGNEPASIRHLAAGNPYPEPIESDLVFPNLPGPAYLLNLQTAQVELLLPGPRMPSARIVLSPNETVLFDVIPIEEGARELAFLQSWMPSGKESAAVRNNFDSLLAEQDAASLVELTVATPAIRGSRNEYIFRILNLGTNALRVTALRGPGLDAAATSLIQCLEPGESADTRGSFSDEEVLEGGWLEWGWKLQRDVRTWEVQRRVRPSLVDSLVLVPAHSKIRSATPDPTVEMQFHNYSRIPCNATVLGEGVFSAGPLDVSIPPGGLRNLRLSVHGERNRSGRMNFRAISGNKEIARSTVDFEFLPPGANLASDSRVRVTCSDPNAEGRSRLLVDGRTTGTGPWAEWVWATDRSETSHWVRLTFPEPQVVMRVTLHWPVLLGTVCFPKSGTLRGLTPSGRVVPLASWQGVAEEIQTSLTFQPVSLESIEWVQAAEDGAENQPDRLQLTEIEVH